MMSSEQITFKIDELMAMEIPARANALMEMKKGKYTKLDLILIISELTGRLDTKY